MIQLDEHRKRNLEMMFQHAKDRDLLHELVRRGRFTQVQASVLFWPEMRDEPRYMDSIRRRLLAHLAHGLADLNITPAVLQEREFERASLDKDFKLPAGEGQPLTNQSVLTADLIVLHAKAKE